FRRVLFRYGTRTWEPQTRWANGRHGSKPAPAMIRLILSSLPISGSASVAFLAATGTFPPTASLFLLEDLMPAAEISLAAFRAAACFQACSSVPAVFRSSA